MNCKPGDLAMYVGEDPKCRGCVVQVIAMYPDPYDAPSWFVDPPFPETDEYMGGVVYDHSLRPIRDPGDDAVDETLLWIGSPTKEEA